MTFEEITERAIKIKKGLIKPANNELKFGKSDIDKVSVTNKKIEEIFKIKL